MSGNHPCLLHDPISCLKWDSRVYFYLKANSSQWLPQCQCEKKIIWKSMVFLLCSTEERNSYRLGTTWGWLNDLNFWVNYPFKSFFDRLYKLYCPVFLFWSFLCLSPGFLSVLITVRPGLPQVSQSNHCFHIPEGFLMAVCICIPCGCTGGIRLLPAPVVCTYAGLWATDSLHSTDPHRTAHPCHMPDTQTQHNISHKRYDIHSQCIRSCPAWLC